MRRLWVAKRRIGARISPVSLHLNLYCRSRRDLSTVPNEGSVATRVDSAPHGEIGSTDRINFDLHASDSVALEGYVSPRDPHGVSTR